jgi:hypothetical protein
MSKKNKVKYLVKKGDVLWKTPRKGKGTIPRQVKDIALKLSIDMFEVHQKIPRVNRLNQLAKYFRKRPGIIEEGADHRQMAIKMYLMNDIVQIMQEVSEMADVRPNDMNIEIQFNTDNKKSIGVAVGVHKRLSKEKQKVLASLVDIQVGQMLRRFDNEHPQVELMSTNGGGKWTRESHHDVEIDDETAKALSRLDWDRTSKGEA